MDGVGGRGVYRSVVTYCSPSIHGLGVRFVDSIGSRYSGSLMPSETSSLNVTPLEVAKILMVKAGYEGRVTEGIIRTAVFMRFTTTKCEMCYEEYREIAKRRKEGPPLG